MDTACEDSALTVQVRVERHGGGGVLPAGVRAGVCKRVDAPIRSV